MSHYLGQEGTETGDSALIALAKANLSQIEINSPSHGCPSIPKSPNHSQILLKLISRDPIVSLAAKGQGGPNSVSRPPHLSPEKKGGQSVPVLTLSSCIRKVSDEQLSLLEIKQ